MNIPVTSQRQRPEQLLDGGVAFGDGPREGGGAVVGGQTGERAAGE